MSVDTAQELGLLSELAELGMVFARKLGEAFEAADAPADFCALTEAFCDVGRGVRQCIALSMRIRNGAFAAQPRAEREPADEDTERPERSEVERADWNEYERPDWNVPGLRLDEPLDEVQLHAAVARIRRTYARAEAVLRPRPANTSRTSLLAGAALRLVDTS